MYPKIIYCKTSCRRPSVLHPSLFPADTQGAVPQGWCTCCGSEVFDFGQPRCTGCRRTKGENG